MLQIGDIKGTVVPFPFIARSKEQPIYVVPTPLARTNGVGATHLD